MENICFSGGATGADFIWGRAATEAGHRVLHFSFKGHKADSIPGQEVVILLDQQLRAADEFLQKANKIVNRNPRPKNIFVRKLLQRNFYQVQNTHRIYAVSVYSEEDEFWEGGTAWAIAMGMVLKVPEIYVFDQVEEKWYQYMNGIWVIHNKRLLPVPSGKYTGIGTRRLNEAGMFAIKNAFQTA